MPSPCVAPSRRAVSVSLLVCPVVLLVGQVGLTESGRPVVNPSKEELARLDLIYAGNEDRTLMIEASAHQASTKGPTSIHRTTRKEG
jgi:polyribonucleotide nucleotidyltransferase